jgi:hypothetical protein
MAALTEATTADLHYAIANNRAPTTDLAMRAALVVTAHFGLRDAPRAHPRRSRQSRRQHRIAPPGRDARHGAAGGHAPSKIRALIAARHTSAGARRHFIRRYWANRTNSSGH